jgi:hypothetical protein
MSPERVLIVGAAWALLLLGLLVLRELLRAADRPAARTMLPILNVLVVVMVAAFSLAAVLRAAELVGGSIATAGGLTGPVVGSSATPIAEPTPASTPSQPSRSVTTPPPTVRATPSWSPSPTAPVAAKSSPSPGTTPASSPAFGVVVAPVDSISYRVAGDRITGYSRLRIEAPITAPATAPRQFQFPTFRDPTGVKRLVRVVDGPLRGLWLSPDDPGVSYRT